MVVVPSPPPEAVGFAHSSLPTVAQLTIRPDALPAHAYQHWGYFFHHLTGLAGAGHRNCDYKLPIVLALPDAGSAYCPALVFDRPARLSWPGGRRHYGHLSPGQVAPWRSGVPQLTSQ
jgi:hypothetical protein